MKCRICSENKLSKEFIPYSMTPECKHPRLMCLRCATKAAKTTGKCPYKDCGQVVKKNSDEIKEFSVILGCLFAEVYPLSDDIAPPVTQAGAASSINIVMMTGEHHNFPYHPQQTVVQLKREIFHRLKIGVERQKLLYDEKELKDYSAHMAEARLADYGIKPNASVFLMVLLYAVPSNLNHVTFDLFWGFPTRGMDYLDASCLIFRNTQKIGLVDWSHHNYADAIHHSGDRMDRVRRIGHHTIQVYLQKIPSNVTHLFFTLSAWSSPTIASYPNPSLRFFEAAKPNTDLCTTTFTHAKHSQAVVMCSVSRSGNQWHIFNSGQLSAGNAKNYSPLITTIQRLIQKGV